MTAMSEPPALASFGRSLRRSRQLLILALMERDIQGAASLQEVCTAMSAFAAAVTQVIQGYSRTQARYSAAKFALELLTSTGVLNHTQAEEVRAQLVNIH